MKPKNSEDIPISGSHIQRHSNHIFSTYFRAKSGCLFDKRTEVSSAEQYFQFYGYLSQQQNMMQDYIRTGTYQKAMLQNFVDFRDKVRNDLFS